MKYVPLCVLLVFALFSACKKDDDEQPAETDTAADYYFPAAVGNYWMYKITMEQADTELVSYDTVRIVGDTVVNAHTYYHIKGGFWIGDSYYRDSAGTVVTLHHIPQHIGLVKNTVLYEDTTHGGFFYSVYRTGTADTSITTPAGTYRCTQTIHDALYLQGSPPPPHTNPRPAYTYYSKNTGIVKNVSWYASSPYSVTVELVGFEVR